MMKSILRLFFTLKRFSFKQICFLIWYRIVRLKPKISKVPNFDLVFFNEFNPPQYQEPTLDLKSNFCKFGIWVFRLDGGGWDLSETPKLIAYNFHYLDDLNSRNSHTRFSQIKKVLHEWIIKFEVGESIAWDAYPVSLRSVNIVKWILRTGYTDKTINESLFQHLQSLSSSIEWHVAANHLFENGKALIFLGSVINTIEGKKSLELGCQILDELVETQFLADGGHAELSPMYAGIVTWGLMDLCYLGGKTNNEKLLSRLEYWVSICDKSIQWISLMTHPDGDVSFFNDSFFDGGPSIEDLKNFRGCLPLFQSHPTFNDSSNDEYLEFFRKGLNDLKASGYFTYSWHNCKNKLIFDAAAIGMPEQPGHAHADSLSFELSINCQRIFVNSGTSTYENSGLRLEQRSTRLHNTVCVNNKNSSDVWSSFRVGKEAKLLSREVDIGDASVTLSAAIKSFHNVKPYIHERKIEVIGEDLIVINDYITAENARPCAYFYLHPECKVYRDARNIGILSGNVNLIVEFSGGTAEVLSTFWYPSVNKLQANSCLRVMFDQSSSNLVTIIRSV